MNCREGSEADATVVGYVPHRPEAGLEERVQSDADPVLHDPVAEMSGEDLAQYWPRHDEADARDGFVCSQFDLFGQLRKIVFRNKPVEDAL